MKRYIKPPMLSTSLTENGKSAKRRLSNILNTRKKRAGAVVIAVAAAAVVIGGLFVSFSKVHIPQEDGRTFAQKLYDVKNPYIGDASANGRITRTIGISYELGAFKNELQTSEEPYVWRLRFENECAEDDADAFNTRMRQYAPIMLALVDNLGVVEWSCPGENGGVSGEMSAESASAAVGADIKSFADSAEGVERLLSRIGYYNETSAEDLAEWYVPGENKAHLTLAVLNMHKARSGRMCSDAAALEKIGSMLKNAKRIKSAGCPFGDAELRLCYEDGSEEKLFLAEDSCAVFMTEDGEGLYYDYGDWEELRTMLSAFGIEELSLYDAFNLNPPIKADGSE